METIIFAKDINKIINSKFISKYLRKGTVIEDILKELPIEIKENSQIANINDENLNNFVSNNSKFNSWGEMVSQAYKDWIQSGTPEANEVLKELLKKNGFNIK